MKRILNRIYILLEPIIFCSLIYIYIYYFSAFKTKFFELNPNPYFVLLLITSLYQGRFRAYAMAVVSYFFIVLIHIQLGGELVTFLTGSYNYTYVLTFFGTATIIGTYSDIVKTRNKNLRELSSKNKILFIEQKTINNQLVSRNNELSNRLKEQKGTILSFEVFMRNIGTMKKEDLYTELANTLRKFLSGKNIAIYEYYSDSKYVKLKLQLGDLRYEPYFILDEKSPFNKILETKEMLVLEEDVKIVEKFHVHAPIYIAPFLFNGEVTGFYVVDKFAYKARDDYNLELFKLVSEGINQGVSSELDCVRDDKFKCPKVMKKLRNFGIEISMPSNINKSEEELTDIIKNSNLEYHKEEKIDEFLEMSQKRKEILDINYYVVEAKMEKQKITQTELENELKESKIYYGFYFSEENKLRLIVQNIKDKERKAFLEKLNKLREGVTFYEV